MKLPYVELLLIGKTSREIKSIDVKYCQILISHYRHCRTSSFLFLFEGTDINFFCRYFVMIYMYEQTVLTTLPWLYTR